MNAGTDLGLTTFQDPQTTLTTTATGASIGSSISDTATLGNLNGTIAGNLVFRAYGPFLTANEAIQAYRNEVQARNHALAQRDEKLRRLQQSFSWQATTWLRLLR